MKNFIIDTTQKEFDAAKTKLDKLIEESKAANTGCGVGVTYYYDKRRLVKTEYSYSFTEKPTTLD